MTAAALTYRIPGPSDLRAALGRGDPALAATGVFLALCLIPTALALALDDRLFNGVSVWIKPMKFQASLAVHLLTVAALLTLLPAAERRGRTVRWLALAMAGVALFEAVYIGFAAARGEASHFNLATPAAAAAYQLMGVGAVILVLGPVWIGALILRRGAGPGPIVLGAGLGLVLGGLLGLATGAAISANAGHWVGGAATDAGGLPIVGWVRDGGDLRVAHFFGLHQMQVLPALGLALWAAGTARWRPAIWAAALLGAALTLATLVQALGGRPFW